MNKPEYVYNNPYVFKRPTGGVSGCSPVTNAPIKEIVVPTPGVENSKRQQRQ